MKRIAIPAILAVLALLSGVWWLALTRGGPVAETRSGTPGSLAEAKRPGAAVNAPLRPEVMGPTATGTLLPLAPRAQPLRDQIRDAPDLRALYERVKDMPDATGERSYRLAEAIFECSIFADMPFEQMSARLAIAKSATQNPRRQELFLLMYERCKGFSGNAAAMSDIIQALHKRAEAAGFPAELVRSLRFEAGRADPDRADQVAIGLLASGAVPDPDVVHEVALYLNQRNQGSPAWRSADAGARSLGWDLLECDYGADCGPRSRSVILTCLTRGACDLQRVEEAILVQGSQAAVNNAMRARETLARQIASRDWVGLGFTPRSKSP